MTIVTFIGGPIDGEQRAIDSDAQMDFSCYLHKDDWVSQQKYRRYSDNLSVFYYTEGQVRFIVETDEPDEDGQVVNLNGVAIPDMVPVLMNFRMEPSSIITYCKVWVSGSLLMCEAMLEDRYLDFNPAIGFHVGKTVLSGQNKIYEQTKLFAVGLCVHPNLNPKIKTIREQVKEQS